MSVSTSTDPVQTIVDILEAAADADWATAGGPPDVIEKSEATDFSRKQRRDTLDAVYVLSADSGTVSKIGARYEPYRDERTVRAEVWTPASETLAEAYRQDIRDISLEYANDNQTATAWTQIAPAGDDDLRASTRARGVDHYVVAELIQLLAARE